MPALRQLAAGAFQRAQARFRRQRMERFARRFGIGETTTILDIGGLPATWTALFPAPRVTLLNLPTALHLAGQGGLPWILADACRLPCAGRSFDIVFSNSVIEHLGTAERQRQFAQEVMRAGRGFFIQTPDRAFPLEQHLWTPFVHWLPKRIAKAMVEKFTVWEWVVRPGGPERRFYLSHCLDDVRLLSAQGLAELFPGATIVRERWLGLPKSLIAWKLP
jgi:hypothetical protein